MPHRRHLRTITALALLAVAIFVPSVGSAASGDALEGNAHPGTASITPRVQVEGSAEDTARVEDVLATFRRLGMALPDLVIAFHATDDACGGHLGLFQARAEEWRIQICADAPFVLPHEIAHAWERANLNGDDHGVYLAARGLQNWRHPERIHAGIEDLAFVVQLIILGDGTSNRPAIDEAFDLLLDLAAG